MPWPVEATRRRIVARPRMQPLIERYSDHSANERTFLTWVRTSIAVMAFGFLVEKFDLFLAMAGVSTGQAMVSPHGEVVGSIAGLLLILLGGAMLGLSMVRFRKTARD